MVESLNYERPSVTGATRVALDSFRSGFAAAGEAPARSLPAALVAAVVAVAVVDYLTGPLLSVSVFYLVPVAAGAALLGRRWGFVLATLSGLSAVVCNVVLEPGYQHRAIEAWNAVLVFATLVFVVEVLARLRERTEQAVTAEQRSRDFLAVAAHQLRAPIAGIRAGVDAVAISDGDDPDAVEVMMSIARDADRAARMISSLLRVARLDEHEPLPMALVDLASVARTRAEWASNSFGSNLSWAVEVAADGCTTAICNADAIGEAVLNLLDNAHRHAEQRVVLSVSGDDRLVTIAVTDDGPGVPRSATEQVFDRFVSLDGRRGSGLGLTIARGICAAHGGTLDYQAGAFVLRIPRSGAGVSRQHQPVVRRD
jgi:signal transduction histidine kinase